MSFGSKKARKFFSGVLMAAFVLSGCAQVSVPDARTLNVPTPKYADSRKKAVNERPDSVMYLPLGEDVLVPEAEASGFLSFDQVGPFELRSETLAGALQLILADYDISLAFETEEALSRRITVANLRGPLHTVVNRVCGLADLYCAYEEGILVVKDTQTFTVTLPPLGADADDTEFLDDVVEGLGAVLGEDAEDPISDPTTRTIVYMATQRTADVASRYFQRLRASTALVVFETYIWEVQLNSGNSTGIDWDQIDTFGKFNTSVSINGSIDSDFTNPVSIGLPTTQNVGATPTDLVQFLSQFGAVKSISQPQITVLSGSEADLRVADTNNYVSEITTTLDEGQSTTAVNTDSVDSGFELTIASSWDKSTVYANIELILSNVIDIENFTFSDSGDDGGASTTIQLPQTSERELTTNIRVRPGDSILIAGLVTENDNFSTRGPGTMKPILPDSRSSEINNLELVILLRPRVVVYTPQDDYRYQSYIDSKKSGPMAPVLKATPQKEPDFTNTYDAPTASFEPIDEPEESPFLPGPDVSSYEPSAAAPMQAVDVTPYSTAPMQSSSAGLAESVPADEMSQSAYTPPTYEPVAAQPQPQPSSYAPQGASRYGGGYVSRAGQYSSDPTSLSAPVTSYTNTYESAPAPAQDYSNTYESPSSGYAPAYDAPVASGNAVEIVPIEPMQSDSSAYYPSQAMGNEIPDSDLQASPYETYDYYVPTY